jgi:hypothetical protein
MWKLRSCHILVPHSSAACGVCPTYRGSGVHVLPMFHKVWASASAPRDGTPRRCHEAGPQRPRSNAITSGWRHARCGVPFSERDLHQRKGFPGHANCLACAADCSARPCGLYRRARTPGAAGNRGHAGGAAAAHSRGSSRVNGNGGDPLDGHTRSTHSGDWRGRPGDARRPPACLLTGCCFRAVAFAKRDAAGTPDGGFSMLASLLLVCSPTRRNRRRWLACSDIRMVPPFAMTFPRYGYPVSAGLPWSDEATRVAGAGGRSNTPSNEVASSRHASLAVLAMRWVGCQAC